MKRPSKGYNLGNAWQGIASWFGARIDCSPLWDFLGTKTVPSHRYSVIYLLGGAALFLFLFQAFSGGLLLLYYQPTENAAHESIERIMTQIPYGWLVRSVHAWGADLFIGFTLLHFLTTLFTRAYRKPRELTWFTGMFLLMVALGFGFSGYLLPWNELSYHATLVGTKIPTGLPVIGDLIVHFLRGGDQVTEITLSRFFAAHIFFLPGLLLVVLLGHLFFVQVQGMSSPLGISTLDLGEPRPFLSEFLPREVGLWLVLAATVATLGVVFPTEMGIKADPLRPAPEGIRPEWYFLFLFKTLKLIPETLGVALFTLAALFLLLLPFLDRSALHGYRSPGFTLLFVLSLFYATLFEIMAWIEPKRCLPPQEWKSETYSLPNNLVFLVLLWTLVGFLLFYLRQLVRENVRIRQLYQRAAPGEQAEL